MSPNGFLVAPVSRALTALALVTMLALTSCGVAVTPTPTSAPVQPPSPTPMPAPTLAPTETPLPAPSATATPADPSVESRYQQPGDYIDSIVVAGVNRWFTVHLPPSYRPGLALPLVLNLHAYTGTSFSQEALSQMHAKADEESFIVVNPQALNDPPSWYGPLPNPSGQPDRDFFRELLPVLQQLLSVDPDRIYATGMSNGGTMSYRLGCDMADVFAAVAPVSGGHVAHPLCQPERPISILVIHGTDDPIIPYEGNGTDSPPVRVWLEAWAGHNNCGLTPAASQPYERVSALTWTGCSEGVEVVLYTMEGGGHTWPGAAPGMTSGGSFPYMSATDAIWSFFQSHPRRGEG